MFLVSLSFLVFSFDIVQSQKLSHNLRFKLFWNSFLSVVEILLLDHIAIILDLL